MVKNHKCEVKPLESSCKDANIDTGMIKSDTKLDRLVRLKRLALLEENAEMYDFDEQMKKFKSNYLEAAITVAHWKTADMNKTNYKSVETEVDNIYSKVMTAWGGGSAFPPKMGEIYKHFKVKLSAITKEVSSEELASKLQDAPQKVLLQHAQDHYDLQVQVKDLQVQSNELKVQSNELKVIKAKAKARQEKQQKAEERAIASAYKIKDEICSQLFKKIKYTGPHLKDTSEYISFGRSGVSPKVFAAAFEVAEGTKKVTFSGSDVGSKALRYRNNYLKCSEVVVKLIGDDLTAKASYWIAGN
jgi:hypothetical protein